MMESIIAAFFDEPEKRPGFGAEVFRCKACNLWLPKSHDCEPGNPVEGDQELVRARQPDGPSIHP